MRRRPPSLPAAPSWLRDVPLAHRGLHGDGVPENSLAAFAAAAAAGVGVELDVQRSRDGIPVIAHDIDLARVGADQRLVADLTAAELAAVRLAGSDRGVPTLGEALAVLADVPVMIEIKNRTSAATLLEPAVATAVAGHPGPLCVASFNPRSLAWFTDNAPEVPRVQTAGPLHDAPIPGLLRWSLRTLRWLRRVRPCAVSYDIAGLSHPAVAAYRATGGCVVTWTVRTAAQLATARARADNVIFEVLPVTAVTRDGSQEV